MPDPSSADRSAPAAKMTVLERIDEAAEQDAHVQPLRLRTALMAALNIHQPQEDGAFSLVSHTYCSCGARQSYVADDGYLSIGPAHYPCATVRAVMDVLGVTTDG